MAENEILLEKENYIATLTINRPQRRNALNTGALIALGDNLNALKDDPETRVIILRGAEEQAFCSGMDLGPGAQGGVPERAKQNPLQYAKDGITYCPKPVIAMIYGYALGAGCDVAVTCDFRIAAEGARLGINPVKLGRLYYHEAIQSFISLVGIAATKELFITGRFLPAARAKEIGLVNQVVPDAELPTVTYAMAQEIAENAPLAVQGTKTTIATLMNYQKLSKKDEAEMVALMNKVNASEDFKEAMKAFGEKRKPEFKGK